VDFTIGVEHRSRAGLVFQPLHRFDDSAWNFLWQDLGVSHARIEEVAEAIQAQKTFIPVLPGFSLLSRLMFIDEGVVRYGKFEIEELRGECMRLKDVVAGRPSQNLIDSLSNATTEAKKKDGEVLVHPFGWSGQ
jgi:hypothetical protein